MKRIGDIVANVFGEDVMNKAEGYSSVFSCWKDLTEKNNIASAYSHSWIKSLDNGLVWIEVDHPGWKQILQTKERKLLYDFRYRFPNMGISAISIMLCRPGSENTNLKLNQDNENFVSEITPDYIVTENDKSTEKTAKAGDAKYDIIKNDELKKRLMRLEQSIIDKNR